MNQSNIALIRLANQQLTVTKLTSPKDLVASMVAMQAQDYPMGKWAIGVRLPGSTDQDIEAAIDNADIIRTHLLRPTWHFVAAEDIYWLLDLTRTQIKAAHNSRDRELELTEAVYVKSNLIIEKVLSTGVHLTRGELVAELNKANIATDQNRSAHLLARAELEKIICSGITRNGKLTYALLSERVQKTKEPTKDEALAQLARRYFTSRCPATLQDFTWWSGLPAADARLALELVKPDFNPETIEGRTYWFTTDFTIPESRHTSGYLLPTYDEFIISYTDRSASIPAELENHMKEISDRGIFRPIIIVNGLVNGIWTRTIKKDLLIVELKHFSPPDDITKDQIEEAAHRLGGFLDMKVELFQKF